MSRRAKKWCTVPGKCGYSEKPKFSLSGLVNKQICRIWGSERPNEVYETFQNSSSVMVWCTSSKKKIIGPYFFEDGNVTGSRCKRMLRHFLLPELRDYPESTILQEDGGPKLWQWSKRIFEQKASWTMDSKRWTDFIACTLPVLEYLWLLSPGPHKGYCTVGSFTDYLWIEDKNWRSNPSHKRRYSQRVFKNIETGLNFVVREKGKNFEHIMN